MFCPAELSHIFVQRLLLALDKEVRREVCYLLARLASATRAWCGSATEKIAPSQEQMVHETSSAAVSGAALVSSTLPFFRLRGPSWMLD